MSRTVETWHAFKQHWHGTENFLLGGECFPLAYELPPLADIVDVLRFDPDVHIEEPSNGGRWRRVDIRESFRQLPLEEALEQRFSLTHYKLASFDGPGKLLPGIGEQVVERWRRLLTDQGFGFNRCYPIIFISGKGCGSSYHLDFSHVLAWQRYGTKQFCSLRDPERWAPSELRHRFFRERDTYDQWLSPPPDVRESDILRIDQAPGTVLWNAFLTPHWVLGSNDEVSLSINLSHGGLHLDGGPLCPHETELERWRREAAAEESSEPSAS